MKNGVDLFLEELLKECQVETLKKISRMKYYNKPIIRS